jgi:chemotaxis protein MotA
MNISSLVGVTAAMTVLFLAVSTATKSYKVFLDAHAILVVIGGTAAASLMCFPLNAFLRTFKVFFQKFLGKYATRQEVVIAEIVDLARGLRADGNYLKTKAASLKTHFLRDALEIINQGGVSDKALDTILKKRAATHWKRYEEDALIFKTIAKFPPAFGLMGTTLGMISLLQQLGGKDSQALLGPAMAIGLVATFYGIVFANLLLIPIGENLTKLNKEDETVREMVIDGIKLIRAKEHPIVVEEYLKSYLLPHERAQLKKGKASVAPSGAKA